MFYKATSLVIMLMFFISGCATIVGDKTQLMNINSEPSSAKIIITDEKGKSIFEGKTPANVTLKKSDGSYFGGKDYVVKIKKEGFQTKNIPINSKPNGWYIAGNIVFGGLIGWLIVDPITGAMYNLKPDQIEATLNENDSSVTNSFNFKKGTLSIVLVQDVPQKLRNKMERID